MPHEITTRKTGFAEMAYVGESPWHGLGQQLVEGATIEQWQQAAGMDWRICRSRVRFGEAPNQQICDDAHVLFRSDNKMPLSIVSPKYKIVQPQEVLEFFRDLCAVNGFNLHTAGTLFEGRMFWALAKMGAGACIQGQDKVLPFVLLSTSCDGTLATTGRLTTVRVVCNNTLSMATGRGSKKEFIISHKSVFDGDVAKDQLGLGNESFAQFLTEARKLAATKVDNVKAGEFIARLLNDTKTVLREADEVRDSKQFKRIMELFKGSAMGGTLAGANGTAWGLVNAVTQYVDHDVRGKTESHKFTSAMFGKGDDLKTAAFADALYSGVL